jgi:hypothetical protein
MAMAVHHKNSQARTDSTATAGKNAALVWDSAETRLLLTVSATCRCGLMWTTAPNRWMTPPHLYSLHSTLDTSQLHRRSSLSSSVFSQHRASAPSLATADLLHYDHLMMQSLCLYR